MHAVDIRVIGSLLTFLWASSCASAQEAGSGGFMGLKPGEAIAFCSMLPEGSRLGLLTHGGTASELVSTPGRLFMPNWSPDGTRISYVEIADKISKLHVADATGANDRVIAEVENIEAAPSWSADGRHIAFSNYKVAGEVDQGGWKLQDSEIIIIRADGTARHIIPGVRRRHPAWSPTEDLLAVVEIEEKKEATSSKSRLIVIRPDGTEHHVVTTVAGVLLQLAWSPDGRQIAFAGNYDNGIRSVAITQIYVINADGTNLRRLIDLHGQCVCPAWSPDGDRIVFHSNLRVELGDGIGPVGKIKSSLFAISLDGRHLEKLKQGSRDNYAPVFRPTVAAPR